MDSGGMLLLDVGITILAATFMGFLARAMRQPLILAYVLAGIAIGPSFLGIITEESVIDTLSQVGISLLLFMVGLELDVKRLKDVGKVSLGCGIGQIVITFVFGLLIAQMLGFSGYTPFYLAFALTLSSTMVVVKLLSDNNEIDTLHGKIVLGTLLVQDIFAILVLASLPTLSSFSPSILTAAAITGLGLVSFSIVSSRFILPFFMKFATKSVELLFLFSLSWCFVFCAFTYLVFLNLLVYDAPQYAMNSISIGAFLAGVSLASFPYNIEIVVRIRPLKDFFLTLFFASLGMEFTIGAPDITTVHIASASDLVSSISSFIGVVLSSELFWQIMILSAFVLVGKSAIMYVITSLFGYGNRTSFMTSISLAQISEFSLILAIQGLALTHTGPEMVTLVTGIVLVTITGSSYFIMHGKSLYSRLLPLLKLSDRFSRHKKLEDVPPMRSRHIVVCGCHRMGQRIIDTIRRMNEDFVVVDYNPDVIQQLLDQKIPCIYGDIGDPEILDRINLGNSKIVFSSIPDQEANRLLIFEAKMRNPTTSAVIVADDLDQALDLYASGADYVIIPKMVSGDRASDLLRSFIRSRDSIKRIRDDHIFKLEDQKKEELLWRYEPSFLKSLEQKFGR